MEKLTLGELILLLNEVENLEQYLAAEHAKNYRPYDTEEYTQAKARLKELWDMTLYIDKGETNGLPQQP